MNVSARISPRVLLPVLTLFATLGPLPGLRAAEDLTVSWTNNMLSIRHPDLPGERLKVWYLEAFCKTGSTRRPWNQTTIPHETTLLSADAKHIRLQTTVEPTLVISHDIRALKDEIEFNLTLVNRGDKGIDVDWFQPCIRVHDFTGRTQDTYIDRCFIFTDRGLTTLDKTRRTEAALYRGGQVYVPSGINLDDVNPRPISPDKPVNGLMGCFSADNRYLLATAWDRTQELFQGVIVCIHNDPRIGGMKAGETKTLRGKIYFMENDPKALLKRYRQDFPSQP